MLKDIRFLKFSDKTDCADQSQPDHTSVRRCTLAEDAGGR